MKRKFAVLAVAGALLAMVVPGSALGYLKPAGHSFEISNPSLKTSLGSCALSKVVGQVSTSGQRNPISSITVGSCTSGTSLTIGGKWEAVSLQYLALQLESSGFETVTMRFASLPGCKLTNTKNATTLSGVWSNGLIVENRTRYNSGFTAASSTPLQWANDGGSCALAGKSETVTFTNNPSSNGVLIANTPFYVNDLTTPAGLISAVPLP